MTFYRSEAHIGELVKKVKADLDIHPQCVLAGEAVLSTARDRSKPIEYRRQLLLRFLNRGKVVHGSQREKF